jgi:polyphosphate kinase
MSDNIEIISVLGRFLEHSRIYWFQSGQENLIGGKVYIGSADLMRRNLRGRIEVMVPIENQRHKQEIFDFLDDLWACKKSSWELRDDGEYYPRDQVKIDTNNPDPRASQDAHTYLMSKFRKNHEDAQNIDRELNKL